MVEKTTEIETIDEAFAVVSSRDATIPDLEEALAFLDGWCDENPDDYEAASRMSTALMAIKARKKANLP